MDELSLDALRLARQGYCCSQILLRFLLDSQNQDNPGLLRALHGLCKGMAYRHGVCGLLTGGVCALAYATGKGSRHEHAFVMAEEMRYKYLEWFNEQEQARDGINCVQILGETAEDFNLNCTELLNKCWLKLIQLFDEYGIDYATCHENDCAGI